MKVDKVREMESHSIKEEVAKLEREVMNTRLGNAIGTIENPVEIRFKKRDIARMKTVLRQRELQNK